MVLKMPSVGGALVADRDEGRARRVERHREVLVVRLRGPGGGEAPSAFPTVNQFCTALLYGRTGRLKIRF